MKLLTTPPPHLTGDFNFVRNCTFLLKAMQKLSEILLSVGYDFLIDPPV